MSARDAAEKLKMKLLESPIATTCLSVGIANIMLFSVQSVIMAGPHDCNKYDNITNGVYGCDKYWGGENAALGKTWNISTLEQCVIDGLRRDYPKGWGCRQPVTIGGVSDCICDDGTNTCEVDGAQGYYYEGFWSDKNLSHFNFYDFHDAPAFMLATNQRNAQNHLGYEESDVSGVKGLSGKPLLVTSLLLKKCIPP